MKALLSLPPALFATFVLGTLADVGDSPRAARSAALGLQEDDEEQEEVGGWLGDRIQRNAELTEQLIGIWNLVEFRHATNDTANVPLGGLLSIQPGLLSIVLHAQEPLASILDDPRMLQAGMHYWQLDQNQMLQTASIISHSNFSGEIEFEPRLFPREYRPFPQENDLTLQRSDGSELIFRRLGELSYPPEALDVLEAARAGRDPFER